MTFWRVNDSKLIFNSCIQQGDEDKEVVWLGLVMSATAYIMKKYIFNININKFHKQLLKVDPHIFVKKVLLLI